MAATSAVEEKKSNNNNQQQLPQLKVPVDMTNLITRMLFIRDCKPGMKLIFGNMTYVAASDVIWNKAVRRIWFWEDAVSNSGDVKDTIEQARYFLLSPEAPKDEYFFLIKQTLEEMQTGMHNLINTYSDHVIVKGKLSMSLLLIRNTLQALIPKQHVNGFHVSDAHEINVAQTSSLPQPPVYNHNAYPIDPSFIVSDSISSSSFTSSISSSTSSCGCT
jgi:hypothetical protein